MFVSMAGPARPPTTRFSPSSRHHRPVSLTTRFRQVVWAREGGLPRAAFGTDNFNSPETKFNAMATRLLPIWNALVREERPRWRLRSELHRIADCSTRGNGNGREKSLTDARPVRSVAKSEFFYVLTKKRERSLNQARCKECGRDGVARFSPLSLLFFLFNSAFGTGHSSSPLIT